MGDRVRPSTENAPRSGHVCAGKPKDRRTICPLADARRSRHTRRNQAWDGRGYSPGPSKFAVSRDDKCRLHVCSAVCSHLGCIASWNSTEHTWQPNTVSMPATNRKSSVAICEVCDRCCNRKRQWPFHHAGLTLFDNRALVCDLIRHIFSARSSASFGFMECQKALSPSDLCHAL